MKILLVGEYSRLHNSLKEGLQTLGHQVTIIGTGDYFKKYPVDIKIIKKYEQGFFRFLKVGIYKLTGIDIASENLKNQVFKHSEKLKGFDIVQLINERSFGMSAKNEKKVARFLKENNKKLFLLSCGTDYTSVRFAFDKKFRYSILDPYFNGKATEKEFSPILSYLKPSSKRLHDYLFEICDGVIASDMDYHIPLQGAKKYLGMIPNPINTDILKFSPAEIEDKIVIFHGINRSNYLKKGNDFFEKALAIISKKYADKIEIIIVESLPYSEYILSYNRAHIVLDQVLSYDQGYNALEAMAKGKVVFTGAEEEFVEYYKLNNTVALNAFPNSEKIANQLENLILHPEKIVEIGLNARLFIETEHNYKNIARQYLLQWNSV